ncbi:MAG: UDP-N-acetylglucosamine 2-epimerase (hydrolyzing) [Planctomycetes bacterium]|nr:UDP-N-acetylglucosamine 2-epimerase (hydrolyzing) [Planctomycetota bacterium]
MSQRRTIAVVTGSRAEYGLLRPVMHAIAAHPSLELRVIVTGTHLLTPSLTSKEVASDFDVSAEITIQAPGATGRFADAAALGTAILGLTKWLQENTPDVVLVLGDRIEAFAAAAAVIGGIHVAHMHGGDRAEGIADEALRHAITKLAHIHLPATEQSAQRITTMGEDPKRIHIVGSPAIDGLDEIPPLSDDAFEALGRPEILFMLHPRGLPLPQERNHAEELLGACLQAGRVLAMHPNHDPGREGICEAIRKAACRECPHLPRNDFIGLLRRIKLLVGNSSAGLIECAALGVRCINVGTRQAGREIPGNVIDIPLRGAQRYEEAIRHGLARPLGRIAHPYGDGHAGERTAELLAAFEHRAHPLAKRNTY